MFGGCCSYEDDEDEDEDDYSSSDIDHSTNRPTISLSNSGIIENKSDSETLLKQQTSSTSNLQLSEQAEANQKEFLDSFPQRLIDRHNWHRYAHGVPRLEIDDELMKLADEHILAMVKANDIVHLEDDRLIMTNGESVGQTVLMSKGQVSASEVVDILVAEYLNAQRDFRALVARKFAPILDRSVSKLGIAVAMGASTMFLTILYAPNEFERESLTFNIDQPA